jgi:D-alanyl-D-alanine dipeptidase
MLKKLSSLITVFALCFLPAHASMSVVAENNSSPIPSSSAQLLLVVTPSYESSQGALYKFQREKNSSAWKRIGAPINIVAGRSGLGWGEGLHKSIPTDRPLKREGDGRSPAGVFALSTAFGFPSKEEMRGLHFPYQQITDGLECVDDDASQHYNTLVDRTKFETSDWQSSEKMFKIKHDYRLGVFVEHNTAPRRPGYGSCIFLHIWSKPTEPTIGCTAMDDEEMEAIIKWLRSEAKPVLVQLPREEYARLREPWQLPVIN